jgi:HK97 family phage portal protein
MGLLKSFQDWRESRIDTDHETEGLTSLNLKALSSFPQHGGANGWVDLRGGTPYNYPNTRINFSQEVGDLRGSTLVMSAIQWVARNASDARLMVVDYDNDRKEKEVRNHPLSQLWAKPNPYYSDYTLIAGAAVSWITASEAYFIKTKARAGNTLWLWWEPHWTIRPRWDKDSLDLIDYYELYRDGKWIRIDVDDVIHICNGLDPETRRGLINPNTALLREYWTDNQVAQFTAQMFRKGLVPPVVVGLPGFTGDVKEFQAALTRKMSGDSAGEPMVTKGEVDVQKLGFDYSSFGFKEIRQIPEERFCAAMGISAHSLMFGAAAQTSTYSNVRQYLQHDYRSYIKPFHKRIAAELDVQLLPDFGSAENRGVTWDYSQTSLMQGDKSVDWRLMFEGYKSRVFHLAQALEGCGYKPQPGDEEIYYPVQMTTTTTSPIDEPAPVEVGPEEEQEAPPARLRVVKSQVKDGELDDAAEFWRDHPAIDGAAKELIDAVPYVNGKVS